MNQVMIAGVLVTVDATVTMLTTIANAGEAAAKGDDAEVARLAADISGLANFAVSAEDVARWIKAG